MAYNGSGSEIAENSLVTLDAGVQGAHMKITLAPMATAVTRKNVLFIAKHRIPAGSYGVILPWKIISGVDTTSVAADGSPILLSDTVDGTWKNSVAGGKERYVGSALKKDVKGTILLAPTMFMGISAI